MLRNTTIVPETDARAAARMIREAIGSLDVVLMMLFGKGPAGERLDENGVLKPCKMDDVVDTADQLCKKTQIGAINMRHVIWVRDLGPQSIQEVLKPFVDDFTSPPVGVVLNFHDKKMATITKQDLEPFEMEMAFAKGHGQ